MDKVNFSLPAKAEYVGVVRLAVSAIANRMGFDVEEIEDIKVCVSEACTNAVKHSGSDRFDILVCVMDDSISIRIKDFGNGFDTRNIKEPDLKNPSEEGGLGIFIIRTLMDNVNLTSNPGEGSYIDMVKYLGDK